MNQITDFGAKIGGARKDLRGNVRASDIEAMNHIELLKHVKKDSVWPVPDYSALVATGHSKNAAIMLKMIRDSFPAEAPQYRGDTELTYKATCHDYVATLNTLKVLESCKELSDFQRMLSEVSPLTHLTGLYTPRSISQHRMPVYGAETRQELNAAGRCDLSYNAHKYLGRYPDWPVGQTRAEQLFQKYHLSSVESQGKWYVAAYNSPTNTPDGVSEFAFVARREPIFTRLRGVPFTSQAEVITALTECANEALAAAHAARKAKHKELLESTVTETRILPKDYQGPSHRTAHARPQDFLSDLTLRGGEFGNWVNQNERQLLLDKGYDAFRDLADAYEWAPAGISLSGTLSIAFGARGDSKYPVASYSASRRVINLTKPNGSGVLAHEYGHAIDHALGTRAVALGIAAQRSDGRDYISHNDMIHPSGPEGAEATMLRAMRNAIDLLTTRQLNLEERVALYEADRKMLVARLGKTLENAKMALQGRTNFHNAAPEEKAQILAKFTKLSNVVTASHSERATEAIIVFMSERLSKEQRVEFTSNIEWQTKCLREVATDLAAPELTQIAAKTEYYRVSHRLDQKLHAGKEPYFSAPCEMFARAFSIMTLDRQLAQRRYNPFLIDPTKDGPFPEMKELKPFASAITPLLMQLHPKQSVVQQQQLTLAIPEDMHEEPSMHRMSA